MPFDPPISRYTAAINQMAAKDPPEWVNIMPLTGSAPHRIEARDGRVFIVEDPARVVAESNAELARQRGPHPIDRDHAMQDWWEPGGPALGWAHAYEVRNDGVYARAEWLAEGRSWLDSRQYLYTSANMWCDERNVVRDDWGFKISADLVVRRFAGFTITNIPALEVFSMAKEQTMSMQKILAALGLADTAGPDDLAREITKLKTAAAPDLSRYVPRADHEAVVGQLEAAQKKLAAFEEEKLAAEHKAALDGALRDGKITPASVEEWRKYLHTAGTAAFDSLMAKLPVLAGAPKLKPIDENVGGPLTAAELAACKKLNMKPEEYAAAKAARNKELAQMRGE